MAGAAHLRLPTVVVRLAATDAVLFAAHDWAVENLPTGDWSSPLLANANMLEYRRAMESGLLRLPPPGWHYLASMDFDFFTASAYVYFKLRWSDHIEIERKPRA